MILILENGWLNLITNYKSGLSLSSGTDLNTIFMQSPGSYYFGDGELQVLPKLPEVVSLERGSKTTQHLRITSDDVLTYFNELHMPKDFSPTNLPFEFLRVVTDGYRLTQYHTRAWIFDRNFGKHFALAGPSFFNGAHKTLLDSYMQAYKSFSTLTDLGIFRIEINKLYENIDKFNGENYNELNKWEASITPKDVQFINITIDDLHSIELLPPGVDPRSEEARGGSKNVIDPKPSDLQIAPC